MGLGELYFFGRFFFWSESVWIFSGDCRSQRISGRIFFGIEIRSQVSQDKLSRDPVESVCGYLSRSGLELLRWMDWGSVSGVRPGVVMSATFLRVVLVCMNKGIWYFLCVSEGYE